MDARLGKIERTSEKNANLLSLVAIAAEKATQKLRNIQILEERESMQVSRRHHANHSEHGNSVSAKSGKTRQDDDALNLQSTIRSFFKKIGKDQETSPHQMSRQESHNLRQSHMTNSLTSNIVLKESSYIQPSVGVSRRDSSKSFLPT